MRLWNFQSQSRYWDWSYKSLGLETPTLVSLLSGKNFIILNKLGRIFLAFKHKDNIFQCWGGSNSLKQEEQMSVTGFLNITQFIFLYEKSKVSSDICSFFQTFMSWISEYLFDIGIDYSMS